MAVSVRLSQPSDRQRWDEYVERSPIATCYHSIGWREVIENAFQHKTYYLLSEDGKRDITGILPLVHIKSLLFGNYMVSLPYFNYGGICADSEIVSTELLDEAIHISRRVGARHLELRHRSKLNNGLPVKTAKVSMQLDLPSSAEQLWNSFDPKLRSQIRKPTKEGLCVRVGRDEELESFYSVFSVNMRDLGTPVYPKQFFKLMLEVFPETTWICTVYNDCDRPLASGFLVKFKERIEIPWASSLRSHNRQSPNMLLYWAALEFACDRGYRVFDFGRSTPGEGTYRFKEQWGASPKPLYWQYWLRNGGPLPELNPKNPKYWAAISLWKKLPVRVAALIGPAIVKNLP